MKILNFPWPFECSLLCLRPQYLSKCFANVLSRWSYELPGTERTGPSDVPSLCSFAKPYSLASYAPVDLKLVYSASLISSFFHGE